ncbi:uncharacterized protein LOC119730724 isoform X1 [Patiria miniata]|uniref:Core-binding (CB) domain-containing protein n=1 Tax=Patiria miniata TaxID=46514 RepID=A0A914A8C1_PATMI|nr:uncharacterized protein LOC119730724 isoform X1 [Patiria miniata]
MCDKYSSGNQSPSRFGFHYQHREIHSCPYSEFNIPWFSYRLFIHDSLSEPGEDRKDNQPLPRDFGGANCHSSTTLKPHRQVIVHNSGSFSSPDLLPQSSGGQNLRPPQGEQLRISCHPFTSFPGGAANMGAMSACMERSAFSSSDARFDPSNGRFYVGMGSLSSLHDRRPLDNSRTTTSYQLPRTVSSLVCHPISPRREAGHPCSSSDGQFNSHCIYQPPRRDSLGSNVSTSCQDLGMVSQEKHHSSSSTYTGVPEHHSRQDVTSVRRSGGMATPPRSLPQHHGCPTFCPIGRPLCVSPEYTTRNVRFMAARPHGLEGQCSSSKLEGCKRLRFSSVFTSSENPSKDPQRGSYSCSCRSSMEDSSLVPHAAGTSNRRATAPPTENRSPSASPQLVTSSSTDRPPPTGRMEVIRANLSSEGLSQTVSATILASWRPQSNAQYNSAWRRWASWCLQRKLDPVHTPVADFLEFLQQLFDEGLSYRTINGYRSAISSAHCLIDNLPMGQHRLVKRFFKGIFGLRPPRPKYNSTWDVGKVLRFIKSLPDNRRLSLRQLTLKLAMLLALVTASRRASLTAIDVDNMTRSSDGKYRFLLVKPSKCVSVSKPFHQIEISKFQPVRNLCPVRSLEEYLQRTRHHRGTGSSRMTQLFLSHSKPFHPVVPSTISRWLKDLMSQSGIDTSQFQAHSTRSASTSAAARAGVSTSEILKTADWSSASTFANFYHRHLPLSDFGGAVLSSATQQL